MKARHIILLALSALPLLGAEEAGMPRMFKPMERGLTEQQMKSNSADDAIARLHFSGEVSPATRDRLKQIWNSGKGYSDRLEALHAWMKELEKDPNSTDAQVFLAWQAAHIWFASHGQPEHRLFMAHIRHTFASPQPTISRHLMSLFHQVNMLEILSGTGCICDDFISITDAINDTNPWLLEALYPTPDGASRMQALNRLWRDPVAYAPQFVNNIQVAYRDILRLMTNDFAHLHRRAKGTGLQRWRYTWGKDLPLAVDAAMNYIDARHNGDIAATKEVRAHIRQLTEDLSPDMLGFVPRSILAAAPTAKAWKPLWDAKASLYDMPDTTAVNLPGWTPKLLSKEGLPPAKVLAEDTARLESLLQKAAGDKTLPAMLAFSLIEDDLALPDETRRSWMNVDGYDTFKAVFDIVVTPNFVDVLVNEKGPHFSKDDKALQAACRELNLTLHRCIVALAIMERDGQKEELKKGCEELAKLLNRTKTWPLVFNEYGLRGISPIVLTELVSHCNGKPALLKGFTELTSTTVTFSAAEQEGNGKVNPKVLARYMRDMMILRRDFHRSEKERAKVAARWLEAAKGMKPETACAMVAYCYISGAPEELLKTIPADPVEYSGQNALRGCCLYRYAMEHGNSAAQEKIIRGMTSDPQYYGYPATRLACAMHARSRGKTAEARRFEKDALILSIAEQHYGYGYPIWQSYFAFLQHGALADLVRYLFICREPDNRDFMGRAIPSLLEQGHFETAAFAAERLINLSLRDATPNNSSGTQLQIVCWRAMADIGHAMYLYTKGDAATADKLMEAALPLLVCDAGTARRVIPVVLGCKEIDQERKDKFRGILAAAAQKSKLPGARVAAAALKAGAKRTVAAQPEPDRLKLPEDSMNMFESPTYTWHLKDSEGKVTELKGGIVRAWYETETEGSWVLLKLESGRLVEVFLNQVAKDDIKNVIDWKEKNKIQVFTYTDAQGQTINAKVCRLYADAAKATTNNTYVELMRPHGEIRTANVGMFKERNELMKLPIQTDEKPELRCFDQLGPAMAYADANRCSLRVIFLGEHGSEYERNFNQNIAGNPEKVREWRKGFVNLVCYRDKAGNWSEAAQGVLAMVHEALDEYLPPASREREEFMKGGGVIEIPFEQRTGNFLVQSAGTVKLAITVKPNVFAGGNASADDVAAMSTAIQKNDGETLRRLVKANPALLRQPCGRQNASSPLFDAVMEGKPAMVQVLLEEGANPNEMNSHGFPVIGIACLHGNADTVRILLEKGADPNKEPMTKSIVKESPINNALGRPAIIKLLVDHGAKVTAEDLFNVLNRSNGNFEAADYIMEKCGDKLDINAPCVMGMMTMLAQMTQNKEVDRVEWLLAHGANANERMMLGGQMNAIAAGNAEPLFVAFCCNAQSSAPDKDLKMLESFLKHGADANATCKTPGGVISVLAKCISNDLFDHALLLLQHGAKADGLDSGGRPLLYTLAERSSFPQNAGRQDKVLQVADALMKNGAKPTKKGKGLPSLKQWAKEKPGGKPRTSDDMLKWIETH